MYLLHVLPHTCYIHTCYICSHIHVTLVPCAFPLHGRGSGIIIVTGVTCAATYMLHTYMLYMLAHAS